MNINMMSTRCLRHISPLKLIACTSTLLPSPLLLIKRWKPEAYISFWVWYKLKLILCWKNEELAICERLSSRSVLCRVTETALSLFPSVFRRRRFPCRCLCWREEASTRKHPESSTGTDPLWSLGVSRVSLLTQPLSPSPGSSVPCSGHTSRQPRWSSDNVWRPTCWRPGVFLRTQKTKPERRVRKEVKTKKLFMV